MERRINRTRFAELGYENVTRGLWRVVDMNGQEHVGPHYRTKAELLADLTRYAAQWGLNVD